ncbi:MAG: M20/M25/M40 family metallo-hydrolase [Planctomycetota bacterium]|nr:M20/M25/M40 family metallo-hydrolase [Planctomycetota bacterium]
MQKIDEVDLLSQLIEAKSPSAAEGPAADVLEAALSKAGYKVQRYQDNIVCIKGDGEFSLLLNSHLDTVPATKKWTRDPWKAEVVDDLMYGLGSTDAKSCIAGMAAAFDRIDPPKNGRIVLTATTEEETGGTNGVNGIQVVLPEVGKVHGGIVGEPTNMTICNGQRGLVRIFLYSEGKAGHASRPWEGVNAITLAAHDIVALEKLLEETMRDGHDPLIGKTTVIPTLINGGTARNVIPNACEICLDIRTTRVYDNERIIARVKELVQSRVDVRSKRFIPVAAPDDSIIVKAARAALPETAVAPFGGVSDLFFLSKAPDGPVPGILFGPGNGQQSHKADEFVSIQRVREGRVAYQNIIEHFFQEGPSGC